LLALELVLNIITESTKLEAFVCSLVIYLFVKLVFLVIELLQYVLFSFNPRCNLLIESTLLGLEICPRCIKVLITFYDPITYLFMDTVLNCVHSVLRDTELIPVVLLHLSDLLLKVFFQQSQLVFKL